MRIRDGFGQTETTVAIANTPGQEVRPGSMGRPVPGCPIVLIDPASGRRDVDEGEICIEHPAVAEAAVVPSPDPLRLAVPKARVALRGRERELHADASASPPGGSRSRAEAGAITLGAPRRDHRRVRGIRIVLAMIAAARAGSVREPPRTGPPGRRRRAPTWS